MNTDLKTHKDGKYDYFHQLIAKNMKNKSTILFVVLATVVQFGYAQSYRVKSISHLRHYREVPDSLYEEFQYTDGKVSSIKKRKNEAEETVNVVYDKNGISATTSNGWTLYAIQLDKAGNVTDYRGTMSGDKLTDMKYKEGKIQSFAILRSGGNKSKFEVKYDASGKMLTIGTSDTFVYEFVYEDGILKAVKNGKSGTYSKEYSRLEMSWENGRLMKVVRYGQEVLISTHEFEYDKEGRVVGEILRDKKGQLLFETSIQYENGDGNDELFYKYYNWQLNMFLGITTYTINPE